MQPHMMSTNGAMPENTTPDVPSCQPRVPVLAELLCSEMAGTDSPDSEREDGCRDGTHSFFDPAILHHPHVMKNLKALEMMLPAPKNYFATTVPKGEILPYMRKVVGSWMLEVCEEQKCDEAVLPLAIGIMDQFLATCTIKKEQLQMVACVCLLLASKSRQSQHFSLELLSWYTDNSVSIHSLRTWELVVLSQLNWDVNILTAFDFIDFILVRTPNQAYVSGNKYSQIVRRHAITFISLCATEPRFVGLKPSLVAASAIYTAMKGMKKEDKALASGLAQMAGVSEEQLMTTATSIDQVISTEVSVVKQQTADSPFANNVGISATVASKKVSATCGYKQTAGVPSTGAAADDIFV